ncbi:MAG: hypothetical protein H0W61_01760 [Bacteroidetes bacterium]|nr:hypothetical protein [Bacteroidota bacterium]
MKKAFLSLICIMFIGQLQKLSAQQQISQAFYGQNFWIPNLKFGGQLENYWSEIKASGVKYIRVGGKDYDGVNMWNNTDLSAIIDSIRKKGFEPIIQVPIDKAKNLSQNASFDSSIVVEINVNRAKNIIYWEIGNEPDGSYAGTSFNYNTVQGISGY